MASATITVTDRGRRRVLAETPDRRAGMTDENAGREGSGVGSSRLRVVQVGAGGMGRAWLSTIGESPDVELVGLVDLDRDVARAAADGAGFGDVPVASRFEEIVDALGEPGPEALINVTVPKAHHPVSTAALLAGMAVLCEKPLAETVSEALSMVAASELTGQLLMVSQSRRYWRNLAALRRQIEQIGPVGGVSCTFYKEAHFPGFREVMAYPLLVDMAIHQFDLARLLIGSEPVSVYCESYNPSWSWFAGDAAAVAVFEFAEGVRFTFDGSWVSPGLETSWNGEWRVSGRDGTAAWDGDRVPTGQDGASETLPVEVRDEPEQIAGSLAEFVRTVRVGGTPWGEVHTNVHSLAMVEAAIRSAESGTRVLVADVLVDAHAQAVADEQRADVRAVLQSWPSVPQALTAG